MIDRRNFLIGSAALIAACAEAPVIGNNGRAKQAPQADFAPILAGLGAGARLGVCALDTGSGRSIAHDEASRFTMCSTFKLPLAAAILAEVEAGRLGLDREIPFTRADILNHSPRAEAALARGRLSVEQLCAAAVEVSDNAAANLLIARIGGPAGLTAFARRLGDATTRFDRIEPELNLPSPGQDLDTTTPAAMVGLLRAMLLGDALNAASRARLIGWMEAATTGRDRLRAGLPAGWRAGDKTGTAGNFNNDLAIAFPPGRPPVLIASFVDAPAADHAGRNAAHAAVGRLVARAFA
jgi:beta-lactamase class A